MIAHPDVEVLSTYLDRELGRREENRVTEHLEGCAECRSTLASLRRVVGRLQDLERLAPPPHLGMQVHRLAALETRRTGPFERMEQGIARINLQSTLVPVFAIVLALVVITYMLSWGVHRQSTQRIPVDLEPKGGIVSEITPPTERQIAERTFTLLDEVWVEEGLAEVEASLSMSESDPRFRSWLEQAPGMHEVTTLGGRVRLRMDDQVVEIRFAGP